MSNARAVAPALIGRQVQLRELDEHLVQARNGAGRLVFLVGDAGIGKTRLLHEFANQAQAGGLVLLEGACYDEQPAPPYGPFLDALQALVRQRGSDAVAQAAGVWASSLAPLLPELGLPSSTSHPTGDLQSDKRLLFEAIARVFRSIAQHGLVLLLEDMHWSDQSSQELVAYLARANERDPILILATYRGDELHRRHPLTHLVAQLTRERRYHEVHVSPLTHDELARLCDVTLGRPATGALIDALYDRTDGNPFFAEELLKALIESTRLDTLIEPAEHGHHTAQLDIPRSLKDSILSRTTDLDSTTTEVMNYAAVIGRRFDFELLHRLTGLTEDELLRAIARLIERQLVVEEQSGEDRFRFRHALTREAIYGDMIGRDRRMRHRRVLQALEQLSSENREAVADQLAYHSLQAKDLGLAGQYARLAGDRAMQMYAYREALAHYETALELLETDDPREKAELFDKLTAAAWPLDDTYVPARYLQEAQRLYTQLADRPKLGHISASMSWIAQLQGDIGAAFAHVRTAIELLEGEPVGPELAMAYSLLSRLYMLTYRPHDSIVWGEQALRLADRLGLEDVRANTLQNIGMSLAALGETQRGIMHLEQALDLAKRTGSHQTASRAYQNLSFVLYAVGQLRRCAGVLREAFVFQHDYGIIPGATWSFLGFAQVRLGQWDQAHETLDRAIRAGELGVPVARLFAIPEKAELLLRQGRLEEARRFESVLPLCEKLGIFTHFGTLSAALARTYLALGDTLQAVAIMDRCIAVWREIGPLVSTEPALSGGIEVYLRAARADSAHELLDALGTIVGRADSPLTLAHYDGGHGLLAVHAGDHAEAAEHFRQAAARWQTIEAPYEEAVARRRLAESLLMSGDVAVHEEARHELAEARAVFERLGAPLELSAADALAEKYGLAAQSARVPTRKGELTARERQVIALIAQGHTNRQIAEALTISEKTAEIHVGNILGKLGCSSRAQAAAYAVQHGLAVAARDTPSS